MPTAFLAALLFVFATAWAILFRSPDPASIGWVVILVVVGGVAGLTAKVLVGNPRWYPFLILAAFAAALARLAARGLVAELLPLAGAVLPVGAFAAGLLWPGDLVDPRMPEE